MKRKSRSRLAAWIVVSSVLVSSGCASGARARPEAMLGESEAVGVAVAALGRGLEAAQASAWSKTKGSDEEIEELALERFIARDTWSALGAQRALTQARPREPRVWFNLGVILEDLGRPDDALEAYREAVALGDPDGELNTLGVCADLGRSSCVDEVVGKLEARSERSPEDTIRYAKALEWSDSSLGRAFFEKAARETSPLVQCEAHAGLMRYALADEDLAGAASELTEVLKVSFTDSEAPSLVVGRGTPPTLSPQNPWVIDRMLEARAKSGRTLHEGTNGCFAGAVLSFEEVMAPLQERPFAFPMRKLISDLKARGHAEQHHEELIFQALSNKPKVRTLDVTSAHGAVLIADMYFDFSWAIANVPLPKELTPDQAKEYRAQLSEYSTPLLAKSMTSYRRALTFESETGSGHPALARAAERLREYDTGAPVFEVGSKARRGDHRIVWKKR